MSTNYYRAYLNKAKHETEYKVLHYRWLNPPYGGFWELKEYQGYYWRRFKTWKHNRKTQWK